MASLLPVFRGKFGCHSAAGCSVRAAPCSSVLPAHTRRSRSQPDVKTLIFFFFYYFCVCACGQTFPFQFPQQRCHSYGLPGRGRTRCRRSQMEDALRGKREPRASPRAGCRGSGRCFGEPGTRQRGWGRSRSRSPAPKLAPGSAAGSERCGVRPSGHGPALIWG